MTTANVLIAAPIFSDAFTGNLYTPSLSGGSWEAGNPLTNLQDRRLHRVARSSGDSRSQTLFTADLGANRPVRCVALVKHTISDTAPVVSPLGITQVRVRGFTAPPLLDAGGDGYDTFATGWTPQLTPTRTANLAVASNGVYLDRIGDDNGAAEEGYYRTVTFTGDGTKTITLTVNQGTATITHMGLFDATAVTWRHRLFLTWTAGVPVATTDVGGGSVTITAIGNAVYRVVITAASVIAANTNQVFCYAADLTAATTGTTHYGDIQAFDAASDPLVYDSGMVAAHPTGTTAEDRAGLNATFSVVVPSGTSGRYWRVNINDDNNPAGYVDIGRLVVAGGYQPTINMAPGATLSLESETTRTVSDGGAAIYDTRPMRRVARFSVMNLPTSEAFTEAWRVQKHLGASTQCFVHLAPEAAAEEAVEQAFLATIRELSAIEYREAAFGNLSLAVVEEL